MNQEIKAQWVTALRSGEYEQGKNWLSNGGQFCCLGVLCELAFKAGVTEKVMHNETASYDGESCELPSPVSEWAGMQGDRFAKANPDISFDGEGWSLAELNDSDAIDFTAIADLIENQL